MSILLLIKNSLKIASCGKHVLQKFHHRQILRKKDLPVVLIGQTAEKRKWASCQAGKEKKQKSGKS
jgi:hypothetical protein